MHNKAVFIVLSATLLALAACQSGASRVELPPEPRGIEGRWSSISGPVQYNVTFDGGRFTSTMTDTGTLLADGTYTNVGPGQVSILYTARGLTAGQQVAVNCIQNEDVSRLSCAPSRGAAFDLVRA